MSDGLKSLFRRYAPATLRAAASVVRHARLVRGPLRYNRDGLSTVHNADFMQDPRFAKAYAKGKATGSWGPADIHWRAHVACWAAERGARLEGDFVECGVNRGGLARTVMEFVDFSRLGKTFYLLDTFEGLVEKYITEHERQLGVLPGGYEPCYEAVVREFASDPVSIVRGAVPETLPAVRSDRVAYLSIDMNCVEPEIAAAEYFWERLAPGAVMLLDDYGWPGHSEQKLAFDRFAARHAVMILSLPTGQAVIMKP